MVTGHPLADLPEFAAGSLPAGHADAIAAHLAGCGSCRADLAGWQALATLPARSRERLEPAGMQVVERALLRAMPSTGAMTSRIRWRLPAALVRAQLRLVHRSVWLGSALGLVVGGLLVGRHPLGLALVVPMVVALGIASVADVGHDAVLDVIRTSRTSLRSVLLTRVALVLAFDLAIGLAVPSLAHRVGAWLGASALLAALALLVAVVRGAELAAAVTVTLWSLRLAADGGFAVRPACLAPLKSAWSTSGWTLTAAVALAAVAVIVCGRGEPDRGPDATTPA